MVNVDRDIKKRWMVFALVNLGLVILIFGALIAGFGAYVATEQRDQLRDGVREYAQELAALGYDELRSVINSNSALTLDAPEYRFALYTVTGGDVMIETSDDFLSNNSPSLGGRANEHRTENVGGHTFETYTVQTFPSEEDGAYHYVKVFAVCDSLTAALDEISVYCIPFVIAFIVVAVVFSFVWGYIAIKPIMTDYVKQKDFINDMSHEIRTPLAVIKGNLENVLASPDSTVSEQSEMLYASLEEVDYMTDISSGLLNIVRGRSASRGKETKMSDVISETVDMFADMATMANKALIANIEYCDLPVDREKIKQLASVLIENAVKYTAEGDRITVRLKNTKDGCVFTVTDTGIGVPKGDLETIFDRFYRAENAKDIPGTGLGLSIAKAIVEGMGGSIKAAANVPCGLEITCVFKNNKGASAANRV